MDKLLILGTVNTSVPFIEYAKHAGIYTIVTDYLPPEQSPAKLVADEYWMINTGDFDALEKKCRECGVTAVVGGCSEFNTTVSIELCLRLGLKSYATREAWGYSRNKAAFKRLCHRIGVPVARDYYISSNPSEDELDSVDLPVVVKPVDLAGNIGVSYCHTKDELRSACKLVRAVSKKPDEIVVERMLVGEEWYSMFAIADGQVRLMALNAMYAQPGEPSNCYTITTTVARHVERYVKEVNPIIERLLREVGCTDGIAWVQLMLDTDGQFYVLEMGYRLDGEMMFLPYKEISGFDTIKWLTETALGMSHSVTDLPKPQTKAFEKCATAVYLFTNQEGTITSIEGFDEIRGCGAFVEMRKIVGDKILKYRPVGLITFTTDNCVRMCEMLERINRIVHVYNEDGVDVIIKYTNFDYLKKVYKEGLEGR